MEIRLKLGCLKLRRKQQCVQAVRVILSPVRSKIKGGSKVFFNCFHFSGGMAKRYSVEVISNYVEKVVFEFH